MRIEINERKFIEKIIQNKTNMNDSKVSRTKMIVNLCKYYNRLGMRQDIINAMKTLYPNNFNENAWFNIIENCINKQLDNLKELKEYDYIPIYQSDIDTINTLDNEKQKKVMFTAFVLARYYNDNGNLHTYDNNLISQWFVLANTRLGFKDRNFMVADLHTKDLIEFYKKNDNTNYKIDVSNDGNEVMRIYDLENIGNQYLHKYKQGWKMCKECGKMYKVKKDKDMKSIYCKQCAKEIHNKINKKCMAKSRVM